MTPEPEFLMVKNWQTHQHYKDRNPPWIKLYKRLLEDYAFACLPDASKAHLVLIWILASIYGNKIPNNPRWVGQKIGATDPVDLTILVSAGFLLPYQDASNVLADCKQDASPREHINNRVHIDPENREQKDPKTTALLNYEPELRANDIPAVQAFVASLGDRAAMAEIEQTGDAIQTLHAFFPPTRIGAGVNPAITRWRGRLADTEIASAIRYMRTMTYRNGDGEELTWGQLDDDHCKRVLTAGLNRLWEEKA